MAYANSTTRAHVIGETSIANSLHYSARAVCAGKPRLNHNSGEMGTLKYRHVGLFPRACLSSFRTLVSGFLAYVVARFG